MRRRIHGLPLAKKTAGTTWAPENTQSSYIFSRRGLRSKNQGTRHNFVFAGDVF